MKLLILFLVPLSLSSASKWNHTRVKRSGITYVWADKEIPYEFKPDFPNRDREMFIRTTKFIEERSCVRFRPKRAGDRYWLILVLGGCCGTHGGRRPELIDKGQEATFSSGLPMPFYLHELGHTFGFPHEQDRPDRDEYVYWDKQKQNTCNGGFAGKVRNLDQAAIDIPFDYVSLMADWTECYWPQPNKAPKNIPLGPGGSDDRTFSVLDFERINAIHDCGGCFGYRFRKITQLAWNTNPVPAGYEINGKTFYICRVYHEGHLIVGKSLPDEDECYVGYEGGERKYSENFSVLTNPRNDANLRWVQVNRANRNQVIKGGRTKDRETIYIGRCLIRGDRNTLVPGFYTERNQRELLVPYGGGVRKCTDFEVLVCG